MTESELRQRLDELEQRLRTVEDERAIADLIASYGPLVDAGEADGTARLWTDDGSYTVEDRQMCGPGEIRAMVDSEPHQRLIARGSAHFLGPAVIRVSGDTAEAVCQSLLCLRRAEGDGYVLLRATVNHFELIRGETGWRIRSRIAQVLDGGERARSLLARAAGR